MVEKRDIQGHLLPDADRISTLGKFLRKYSLDEFPQVINILRGEMSWVGPRPLPPVYGPLFNDRQKIRFQRKPGITGWAQVNGRNRVEWPKRLEMDVYYVEHYRPWLDIKIMGLTIISLIFKADGEYPSAKFTQTP